MEQQVNLPSEYRELNVDSTPFNEMGGDELDLNVVDNTLNLGDSDTYKMIGEEEAPARANVSPLSNASLREDNTNFVKQGLPENIEKNYNSLNQNIVPNNNTILPTTSDTAAKPPVIYNQPIVESDAKEAVNIDDIENKIQSLENLLKSLTVENNLENNDNNSFNEQTNNSFLTKEQFNETNKIEQVKNIINEINNLKKVKNDLSSNLTNTQLVKNELLENIFNDNAKVSYDNFTPNFKLESDDDNVDSNNKIEKTNATQRAIETEIKMGGDPVVEVVPGVGEVVIDSKTQENVSDAVKQHGGWGDAINDSIINQSYSDNNKEDFFSNTSNNENIVNKNFTPNLKIDKNSFLNTSGDSINNDNFYKTDNIENINTTSNESFFDEIPDPNINIAKNTLDSIAVLNKISKQLENISKSINNSFGGLKQSLKDMKVSERNNYYQTSNNNTTEMNRAPMSNSQSNNIQEVRGNFPLDEDFPKGFNKETLYSNLRP